MKNLLALRVVLLVGFAFAAADPAHAGVTLTAEGSGRIVNLRATTNGHVDGASLLPPTLFDFWIASPRAQVSGSDGSAIIDVVQQSEANLTYLTAQGEISGAASGDGSITGNSYSTFTFAVQDCEKFTLTSSLAANANSGSNTGSAVFQFLSIYPLTSDASIIERQGVDGSGAESVLFSTGQISSGNYLVRGESRLPLNTSPGVYSAPNYNFFFLFGPCLVDLISQQPQGQSVLAGNPVTLSVLAAGVGAAAGVEGATAAAGDFTYQWIHKGQQLVDDGRIAGATTNSLTVRNFGAADEGGYSVWVDDGTTRQLSSLAILVPEPGFAWMIGFGAICLAGLGRNKNRQ